MKNKNIVLCWKNSLYNKPLFVEQVALQIFPFPRLSTLWTPKKINIINIKLYKLELMDIHKKKN